MTPEEMKEILGQMLQVQRQQQESDLRNQQKISELTDVIGVLTRSVIDSRSELSDLEANINRFVQATNRRLEILEDN